MQLTSAYCCVCKQSAVSAVDWKASSLCDGARLRHSDGSLLCKSLLCRQKGAAKMLLKCSALGNKAAEVLVDKAGHINDIEAGQFLGSGGLVGR